MRPQVPLLNNAGGLLDWSRRVALALNVLVSGYPFPPLDADPVGVSEGYTYFNTVSKTVRMFNGTVWQVL